MSRWGNLRQNAIRGNVNNLRTSAVRQSTIRQGQIGDAIFALPWVWMVDARNPGVLSEPVLPGDLLTASEWALGGVTDSNGTEATGYTIESVAGGSSFRLWRGAPTNMAVAPWSWGLDVKAGTLDWFAINNAGNISWVNGSTGALGTQDASLVMGATTALGDGWFRVPITASSWVAGELRIYSTDGDGVLTSNPVGAEVLGSVRNVGPLVQQRVASWPDLIASNNPVQVTSDAQPIWLPDSFNGMPTVRADGIDDLLRTPTFGLAQPYEVWMVNRWRQAAGSLERTWDGVGGASETGYIQRSAADTLQFFAGGSTATVPFAATAATPQSIGCLYSGASSETIVGGVAAGASLGTNDPDGITIFASRSDSAFSELDLSFAGVTSRALTTNERTVLRAYLNQQWGPLV